MLGVGLDGWVSKGSFWLTGSAKLAKGTTYKPSFLKEPDGIPQDFLDNCMFCSPTVKVLAPVSGLQMCAEAHRLSLPHGAKQSPRLNIEHLLFTSSYLLAPGLYSQVATKSSSGLAWGRTFCAV